jgi:hypothetical protein
MQMIVNLLLLRGNIGKPGAGVLPVRGHSNVQGRNVAVRCFTRGDTYVFCVQLWVLACDTYRRDPLRHQGGQNQPELLGSRAPVVRGHNAAEFPPLRNGALASLASAALPVLLTLRPLENPGSCWRARSKAVAELALARKRPREMVGDE